MTEDERVAVDKDALDALIASADSTRSSRVRQNEVPFRIRWVNGHAVPRFPAECEPHTDSPRGDLQWLAWSDEMGWHAWSDEMGQTHTQMQCKGCGLWSIWEYGPSGSMVRLPAEGAVTQTGAGSNPDSGTSP